MSRRPVKMFADCAHMAIIGTAAAADDAQAGQKPGKLGVWRAELRRIAVVKLGRLVQFGMAEARGIGPDAADPVACGSGKRSNQLSGIARPPASSGSAKEANCGRSRPSWKIRWSQARHRQAIGKGSSSTGRSVSIALSDFSVSR